MESLTTKREEKRPFGKELFCSRLGEGQRNYTAVSICCPLMLSLNKAAITLHTRHTHTQRGKVAFVFSLD